MNFQLLAYPLNVYAQTLNLEYGGAEHLHFGIHDADGGEDFFRAQHTTQELLRSIMLPAPARVLEIGFGLGALSRALAADGYTVTAVSNNPEEIRIAKQASADVCYVLSDFADPLFGQQFRQQQFDILLFQHSAQYFDSIQLLAVAKKLLKEDGQLLILDEFLLDDNVEVERPQTVLKHFLVQAQRCGLNPVAERQLGALAAPGLLLFRSLLEKHKHALAESLALAPELIAELGVGLMRMATQLQSEQMGFSLLDFRCAAVALNQPDFGNIHSFDSVDVVPLFESSFGNSFDFAVWDWKYSAGRGKAIIARVDGKVVAHYGGATRDIRYYGLPRKAVQICDVMVMREHRSFANRDTLFFKVAATFLEQHTGNAAEHLLGFGFPNLRVLRVAKKLRLYDTTDCFIEIHYPHSYIPRENRQWEISPFDLLDVDSSASVDILWHKMANDFEQQIVGVRDLAYLRYRYCSHPLWQLGTYYCLSVRMSGNSELTALVILKRQGEDNLLMDIIGAVEQFPDVLEALLVQLQRAHQSLHCKVTKGQADKLTLPGSEWRDTGIEIPCNIWTAGPPPDALKEAWWLTAGDMDFI